jgi:hypothetical protein
MGCEVEIRVDPGISHLTGYLSQVLRETESIGKASFTNIGDKQSCAVTTEASRKTDWPQCCEFVLEEPTRIYVLAHLGIYLDIARRLASQLEEMGHSVNICEL